jgi:hypothetical protein
MGVLSNKCILSFGSVFMMIITVHNQYRGSPMICVHVSLLPVDTSYSNYFEISTEKFLHEISQTVRHQPVDSAHLSAASQTIAAQHPHTHQHDNQSSIFTSNPRSPAHTEFDFLDAATPRTVSKDNAQLAIGLHWRKFTTNPSRKCWKIQLQYSKYRKFFVMKDASRIIPPISRYFRQPQANLSMKTASESVSTLRFSYPWAGWVLLTLLKGYHRFGKCGIYLLEQSSPAHLFFGWMVFAAPFTHATHAISAVKEMNQPATGGTTVSISGSVFVQYSAVSRLGDSVCEQTLWISGTSLLCNVVYGIGASLPTYVFLQNVTSSSLTQAITYHFATLSTAMSTNTLENEMWSFTIFGGNFGVSSFSSKSRVKQTGTMATDWTAETALVCKSASGSERSLKIIVSLGALVATLTEIMSYGANQISSLNRLNQPVHEHVARAVIGSNFANHRCNEFVFHCS